MRPKPQSHKVKRMLNDKGGIFKILSLFNKDENKVNYLLCKNGFFNTTHWNHPKKTLIIVLAKRLMRVVYGYPNEGIP